MTDIPRALAAIIDLLPVAIALVDSNGAIVGKSGQMACVLGDAIPSRDPDEAKRWHFADARGAAIDREHWPAARALRGEVLHSGMIGRYRKDGERLIKVVSIPFTAPHTDLAAMTFLQLLDRERRSPDGHLEDLEERFIDTLVSSLGAQWERTPPNGRLNG